jgi:hypothetical protein
LKNGLSSVTPVDIDAKLEYLNRAVMDTSNLSALNSSFISKLHQSFIDDSSQDFMVEQRLDEKNSKVQNISRGA